MLSKSCFVHVIEDMKYIVACAATLKLLWRMARRRILLITTQRIQLEACHIYLPISQSDNDLLSTNPLHPYI
jgi:hypothetical protein